MVLIIMFVLGLIVGSSITVMITKQKSSGTLRIDSSDQDDGPYMFLELSSEVEDVYKKKQIFLDVNTESYISQK